MQNITFEQCVTVFKQRPASRCQCDLLKSTETVTLHVEPSGVQNLNHGCMDGSAFGHVTVFLYFFLLMIFDAASVDDACRRTPPSTVPSLQRFGHIIISPSILSRPTYHMNHDIENVVFSSSTTIIFNLGKKILYLQIILLVYTTEIKSFFV